MSETNKPESSNTSPELFYLLVGIMAVVLCAILARLLTLLLYAWGYPLVAPAFVFGDLLVGLGISVLCLGAGLYLWYAKNWRKRENPMKFMLFTLSGVFALGAVTGSISKPIWFCNPASGKSFAYLGTCQNDIFFLFRTTDWLGGLLWTYSWWYGFLCLSLVATLCLYYIFNPKADPYQVLSENLKFDGLLKVQSKIFPWLRLPLKLQLGDKDLNTGRYRLLSSVRQFVVQNALIDEFKAPVGSTEGTLTDNTPAQKDAEQASEQVTKAESKTVSPDKYKPSLNFRRTQTLFLEQLGDIYTTFQSVGPLELFVFAVALPRACSADTDISTPTAKLIEKNMYAFLDKQWDPAVASIDNDGEPLENPFYTHPQFRLDCYRMLGFYHITDEQLQGPYAWLLEDPLLTVVVESDGEVETHFDREKLSITHLGYKDPGVFWLEHPLAKDLFKSHAYTNTLIYATIMAARRLGVLTTVDLGWIRCFSRPLWALLQSVGRGAPFIEASAVVNHYNAELISNQRLYQPQLKETFTAVLEYLARYSYPVAIQEAYTHYVDTGVANKALLDFVNLPDSYESELKQLPAVLELAHQKAP